MWRSLILERSSGCLLSHHQGAALPGELLSFVWSVWPYPRRPSLQHRHRASTPPPFVREAGPRAWTAAASSRAGGSVTPGLIERALGFRAGGEGGNNGRSYMPLGIVDLRYVPTYARSNLASKLTVSKVYAKSSVRRGINGFGFDSVFYARSDDAVLGVRRASLLLFCDM